MLYKNAFSDLDNFEIITESKNTQSNYWLITLRLLCNEFKEIRDKLLNKAHNHGIIIRPSWKLLSELPMYECCERGILEESENQSYRLINLPSSPK